MHTNSTKLDEFGKLTDDEEDFIKIYRIKRYAQPSNSAHISDSEES
jgi:hypothetical protein